MNRYVVVPHHGSGRARLVRQGRTVLFTTGDGPAAAALAGWCRLFGDRPSAEILEELTQVTSDNPTLGAFALLVLDDDGIEVAVSGHLPVAAHGASGVEVISGGDGFVRRRVQDVSVVGLTVPGAVVDPLLELDRGIIAADGFEVRVSRPLGSDSPWSAPAAVPAAPSTPTDADPPAAARAPAPVATPVPAAVSGSEPMAGIVSLHAGAADDLPVAAPLPLAAPAPEPVHDQDDTDEAVRVQGLQCARGHFNDPRARYCGVCGIAMHQASFVLVEDVRPPLGVLVFGDGAYHTLAKTMVVGRDPSEDPAATSGDAVPLALNDPTNTLSRIHAEVRLVGWDVEVVDRHSTNGTFVWAPGQTEWERLVPGQPRNLQPGAHVSFGRLTATFESSQRQR